jgi:phage/plasmid-like protein (TIGR03299 family)
MSHLIDTMAYTGQTPWHQLGHALPKKQSIDVWANAAGMQWKIQETPVRYMAIGEDNALYGEALEFPEQKVLYRSDTHAALSVVSQRYKVVQPQEVLEFYRDLSEVAGFELETAGVLKAGRRFWALARTGKSACLKGNDVVHSYLLLATSCDGTLATMAIPTSVRVVCNNTLAMALQSASANGNAGSIKVPHSTQFNAQAVKRQLGIAVGQWDSFMYRMKTLAERKVKTHEAMNYFLKVICQTDPLGEGGGSGLSGLANERALKKVQALFEGHGRGAELQAAKGTAWGLLSAVTEFVDHEKQARSQDNRLDSAWFGQGAALKHRALEHALQLVA